jgi:hypothetical protein
LLAALHHEIALIGSKDSCDLVVEVVYPPIMKEGRTPSNGQSMERDWILDLHDLRQNAITSSSKCGDEQFLEEGKCNFLYWHD